MSYFDFFTKNLNYIIFEELSNLHDLSIQILNEYGGF
jgi:hypothetical protein